MNSTPAPGAVAWSNAGSDGHVAWVSDVRDDGSIDIEQYNADYTGHYSTVHVAATSFTGYIHIKDLSGASNASGSPFGSFDAALPSGGQSIVFSGWTIDPNAPTTSGVVHVYLNGPAGSGTFAGQFDADIGRQDVANANPGAGSAHGVYGSIRGISPGAHAVYMYAINVAGSGDNVLLGSKSVTVGVDPQGTPYGSLDRAVGTVSQSAAVDGWTIDPSAATTPTHVHVYVDGWAGSGASATDIGLADGSRPDVGAANAGAGDLHGFSALVPGLAPGPHVVFVYAIDADGGSDNPLISSAHIIVPGPSPIGSLDSATGGNGGVAEFVGWSLDPYAPSTPTRVDVYVDGPAGSGQGPVSVTADLDRDDVAGVFPGASAAHGYKGIIGNLAPGQHTLYAYGIDVSGGSPNALIGQMTVTVPATTSGSDSGSVDYSGAPSPGVAEVRGWLFDPDSPTTPAHLSVCVDISAAQGGICIDGGPASLERDDVASVYPSAGADHGFDVFLSGQTPGPHVYWVYADNMSGAGDDVLLGAQHVVIGPGTFAITTPSLPSPVLGTPVSDTLAATSATGPLSWAISSGTLPPGLSLSPGGVISGTPSKAGTLTFTVTVTDSSLPAQAASKQFTMATNPTVTAVSPSSGTIAGGRTVTITGTGFSGAIGVRFAAIPATAFTVVSPTRITATTPAHTAGTVNIYISTPGGLSPATTADRYTFAPVPAITAVSPSSGTTAGGRTVTITGTGFSGAIGVRFAAISATAFTVVSPTRITATTPAHTAGTVNIYISTPGGLSPATTADRYTFAPVPAITAVSPSSGTTAGGRTVTITGTGFSGATGVRFAATPATAFTVVSPTRITATTPAHTAGTVNIYISTPSGLSPATNTDRYVYTAATSD